MQRQKVVYQINDAFMISVEGSVTGSRHVFVFFREILDCISSPGWLFQLYVLPRMAVPDIPAYNFTVETHSFKSYMMMSVKLVTFSLFLIQLHICFQTF